MRVVVYSEDLLPITVLNLRGITDRDIERMGRTVLAPVPPRPDYKLPPTSQLRMEVVTLRFELFRRKDHYAWMCFTKDEELAMLCIPDWLPGQRPTMEALMEQNDSLTRFIMEALCPTT